MEGWKVFLGTWHVRYTFMKMSHCLRTAITKYRSVACKNRNLFLTFLEAGYVRSVCRPSEVLQTGMFSLYPQLVKREGKRALQGLFYKSTNPINKDSTHITQSPSKTPPPNTSFLVVFQDDSIQSIAEYKCKHSGAWSFASREM